MELWTLTARELASGFRAGAFSPVDACDAILARIAELDGDLGSFATLDAAGARAAALAASDTLARGEAHPLCGVPLTVKDLIATRGLRTTGGSRLYEHNIPDEDSAAVARVRATGAVILGKTTTCEFGHKLTGDSALFGLVRNPHDRTRTTGGSSGGAASALAAGFGPLALGTDALGSIRVPAAFCGVVGLKPTYGLVPRAPGLPPSWDSLAHTGPMGRSIDDVALLLETILGPDDRDRATIALPATFARPTSYAAIDVASVRVGFAPTLDGAPVDPEVALAIDDAVATLRAVGLGVCDVVPEIRGAIDVVRTIGLSELAASRASDDAEQRASLDPSLARILATAPVASAIDYVRATAQRTTYWRALHALFYGNAERAGIDVLVLPTVPIPAFAAGALGVTQIAGVTVDEHLGWSPFTYPFNLTGLPALTLPTRLRAAGMPVGLQIVGRRYAEATLLAVGAAYEGAIGSRTLIAQTRAAR